MARQVFASPDSISGIETGHRWPSVSLLREYESACGLSDGVLVDVRRFLKSTADGARPTDTVLRTWELACGVPEGSITSLANELYEVPKQPKRWMWRWAAGAVVILAIIALAIALRGDRRETAGAEISSPAVGTDVCYEQPVHGTSWSLQPDDSLWLFVRPLTGTILYPQPGRISVQPDDPAGRWSGTAYFGGSLDGAIGDLFELTIVLATPRGNERLVAYAQEMTYSGLKAMPEGTRTLHTISVRRAPC